MRTADGDALFINEKSGERLKRRHIRVGNGRPGDCDQLFGRVEPRREQILGRVAHRHAAIDPEVVKGE